MRYTHHFELRAEPTPEQWRGICEDARRLFDASPVALAGRFGDPRTEPEIDEAAIVFNGVGDESYEPFNLPRSVRGYMFCKTGFSEIKGYDLIAKAILIAAHDRAPDSWRITSDGFDFEWWGARRFTEEVLGRKLELPPGVEANEAIKDEYRSGLRYERAKEAYFGTG